MRFLIDKDIIYTYEELLEYINNADCYYPLYQTDRLYYYMRNLLVALVTDNPITLLDSDFKKTELTNINFDDVNKEHEIARINKCKFNISELINAILDSKSKINIFTSGTTGQPKKVEHTIKTLTRFLRIDNKYTNQIWAFAYNPTHIAGLQVLFQALCNKNCLINVFNLTRKDIYQAIGKYDITHISATPTFYRLLLPIENQYESVVRVTFGGEKSEKKLYNSILKIFPNAKINNIYASTEAGSLFVSKGDVFTISKDIKDKVKEEEGELMIHKSLLGESASFSYNGDYYKTGDIIEWIDERHTMFRFVNRKNGLINVGGYKVNPEEVENKILEIGDVLQTIVYGRPNSILGNVLCAEIKLVPHSTLTEVDIRCYLKDKIQDFKIPRRIKFVDTFSLTRTGKIKR